MTAVDPALLGPQATMSIEDMAARLRAVLPMGWFADRGGDAVTPTPVLDAVLAGEGAAWAAMFAQLQTVFAQTRLQTASGGALDMISADFFGPALGRADSETDAAFRARIGAALLPNRATRTALLAVLGTLAPISWVVTEPGRVADTGVISNAVGLHATGGYGSPSLHYGSRSFIFGALIDGVSDSPASAGLRTSRDTTASVLTEQGTIAVVPPFSVRTQGGSVLAEPRGWNLIGDSSGWTGFDLGIGGSGRAPCSLSSDTRAILPGGVVLSCTAMNGTSTGPVIDISAGRRAGVASAWVWVPTDSAYTSVSLVCLDGESSTTAAADMSKRQNWQRLVVSLPARSDARTVRMQIVMQASASASAPVITQCWQFEPGTAATSHIPTSGFVAWRSADTLSTVASPVTSSLTAQVACSTVASTLPVAVRCGVRMIQS